MRRAEGFGEGGLRQDRAGAGKVGGREMIGYGKWEGVDWWLGEG